MPDKFNPSRTVRSRRTEFRTRSEGETPSLSGYFVVFDQPYYWDETMEEVIKPGAFDDCDMSDVRCLTDHLSHLVLGRANETVHTLSFSIDDTGVYADKVEINAADTDAMNLYARVQRGDVSQCSFGFDILDEEYIENPSDGSCLWIIHKVKLYEVSVVTFPAYVETSVEARRHDYDTIRRRKLDAWKNDMKERLHHGS